MFNKALRRATRQASILIRQSRGPLTISRSYASAAPPLDLPIDKTDSPTRSEIFEKITGSPKIMGATMKMIELMESRGLSSQQMPTPDEWSKIMTDEEVQSAIKAVGEACDEAGVPMNSQVLAELTSGMGVGEKQ